MGKRAPLQGQGTTRNARCGRCYVRMSSELPVGSPGLSELDQSSCLGKRSHGLFGIPEILRVVVRRALLDILTYSGGRGNPSSGFMCMFTPLPYY